MKFTDENGIEYCARELARSQGVAYNTLVHRKCRGWTDLEIIAGKRPKVFKSRLMEFKDEIISMRTAGENLSDIGERFGTDAGNLTRFLKNIGFDDSLFSNKVNSKMADDVSRLRSSGCSITEIATKLGVAHSTVWHYLKRLGFSSMPKPKKRVYSDDELEGRRLAKNKRLTKWREENKEEIASRRIERKIADPVFALKERVRATTGNAFKRKRWRKGTKTHNLLGCDWMELKLWIESLFTTGMSWDNMGEWHVDHKIPLASASTVGELKELCRFTNLQPLWARDNLSKGSRH